MRLIRLAVLLALSVTLAPLVAEAQQAGKVWRIGFLGVGTTMSFQRNIEAMRLGLREHGYVEGRNITMEFRWAEGRYDRLPALAAELVQLKLDVIITHGRPGTLASDRRRRRFQSSWPPSVIPSRQASWRALPAQEAA